MGAYSHEVELVNTHTRAETVYYSHVCL